MVRRLFSHPLTWGILTSVLLAWLGMSLRFGNSPIRAQVEELSYDGYYSWLGCAGTPPTQAEVMVITLDQASHQSLQQSTTRPWPRNLHAQLIDRLKKAGARSITFDILFDQPGSDPGADKELARAIREAGNVILCGERSENSERQGDGTWGRMYRIVPPYAPLAEAAAAWGLAALQADEDFTSRKQYPGMLDENRLSLHAATARFLGLPAASPESLPRSRWNRYYGPSMEGLPHVSYATALDPNGVQDSVFKDRILFIGARSQAGLYQDRRDEFRSPFRRWRKADTFMPGVSVHATQMLNLVRGDWLRAFPPQAEQMLILAAAFMAGIGLSQFRPVTAAALGLSTMAAFTACSALLFQQQNLWFSWLIPVAIQIPLGIAATSIFRSLQWFFARQAFLAAKRAAENRIREQAALIDKANDAILVRTLTGHLRFANPAAQRLLGGSLEELQASFGSDESWGLEPDALRDAMRTLQAKGEWQGEISHRTRAGDLKLLQSRWTLLRDDPSAPPSVLLINSDVTEKKQLETQVLRTQRLDTIGSLAGGMAHDLNNALAPVLMGVHLLRRKAPDTSSREILDVMESSTQRGADMVRQVLLFARGHDQAQQSLDLAPLVKELKRMMADTFPKNIGIIVQLASDLWKVRGQSTQLHQVLLNLCVNARDAIQEQISTGAQASGTISISAENVDLTPEEAAQIPSGRPGAFVALMVSDTGNGIPPEILPRIFEPFFSTKATGQGTGLGLATTLRIIKNHDGFLHVRTEPGQGTTFEIFLPKMETSTKTLESTDTAVAFDGQGRKVLVVDDDEAVRSMLKAGLEAHGCQVIACEHGKAALDFMLTTKDAIALCITDTDMPHLGGPELVRTLRQRGWKNPAILLSGREWDQDFVKSLPPHVQMLRKPFTLEALISAVKASE